MLSIVALTIGLTKEAGAKDATPTIEKLQAILTHIFLVIIVIFLVSSPLFLEKIHLNSSYLFPICAMLALSVSMSIISGYLNAKQKLVKLGLAVVFSAFLQFVLSIGVAVVTKNGATTLIAMALGSLLAVMITYQVYKSENLPRFSSIVTHKISLYRSKEIRSLVIFTISASVSTLIMNILLIADLLIISERVVDAKLYADIYVISRIVYFSGMLFLWPFMSNVDIKKPYKNRLLFLKLSSLFAFLSLSAAGIMALFGQTILQLFLGSTYQTGANLNLIAILAISFKFIFLIITTLTVYFIIMRSYWAIKLPITLLVIMGVSISIFGSQASTIKTVAILCVSSGLSLLIGLTGFILSTKKSIS